MSRVEPTHGLLAGGPYTPALHSDIRKRFASLRAGSEPDFAEVYRFFVQLFPRPQALQRAIELTLNNKETP